MSLSKKRKVDQECRVFQDSWSVPYFFAEVNGIPVCLVCSQQVSVVKEYNILIANYIALASKPYCEGEFVKTCILKATEIVCSERRRVFANISLTRNTVAERISDLSANLDSQLKNKVKSFVTFLVALDESTDISDIAQLAIFIRGIDGTLSVTEEFLGLVPMIDTTAANDIFNSLVGALNRVTSRLVPCCQYCYRWCTINDREKSRCCDKI